MTEEQKVGPAVADLQDPKMIQVVAAVGAILDRISDPNQHDFVLDLVRKVQAKPGVRATEFWLGMLITLAGFGLHFVPGQEVHGTVLMVVAGVCYTASRTYLKAS